MSDVKKNYQRSGRLAEITPDFSGKVRDIYDLGDQLLIVASDRISAFDSVLPTPIPGKGIILTMISAAWFRLFEDVPNHLISTEVGQYPDPFSRFQDDLDGRSMLVRKAERIDIECIVRGYIIGSGWKEYRKCGKICGIELPPHLILSDKLDQPIFTPSTKAESGHDENITLDEAASIVSRSTIEKVREVSLDIYTRASEYAASKGIIIADTKFEFGSIDDSIVLIDEVLTPDSSRFWLKEEYEPGRRQLSLDKQFVRDYLDEIGWDHNPPAPELTNEIVDKTRERYRLVVERLFPELVIERFMV
ncbi:MAG: phosphoribosylaminoimidazolesuccinocarboxamide synthase [Candidatus Krumholzibacteria bacterium]|nr:phosphoribosylaminoimidazolesuccinocarboxamide synthase [Candidatus Krumholzibacteria bacterium]